LIRENSRKQEWLIQRQAEEEEEEEEEGGGISLVTEEVNWRLEDI
jgi:hypothetical protein